MEERTYLGDGEHYFIITADKYSGEPLVSLYKDGNPNRITCWNVTFDELKNKKPIIEKAEVWVMRAQNSK